MTCYLVVVTLLRGGATCGHFGTAWAGVGGMRLGDGAVTHCHVGCGLLCGCMAAEWMNISPDNMFPEPEQMLKQ